MNKEFRDLVIGGLHIEIPIIQGGMGVRVSGSSLASTVSNEGGLGVIAAVGLGEEGTEGKNFGIRSCIALGEIIKETRTKTKKPFGVNLMCALTDYEAMVDVAQKEGVDVIISGAGLPLKLPSLVKNSVTKLIPIVSSGRAAKLICNTWLRRYKRLPDAMVVEGPMAGGHLGYSREELNDPEHYNLDAILKDVLVVAAEFATNGKSIPVIAAGGIFDGKDIARVIKLGASGVQMGTRFVCTNECDASPKYKELFLSSTPENIVVVNSPVGMPGRVIRNEFVKKISTGERIDFDCAYQCLVTCDPRKVNYCIAKALINAYRGDLDKGFAMCGSNAYRIKKIVSVKELITELSNDARRYLKS